MGRFAGVTKTALSKGVLFLLAAGLLSCGDGWYTSEPPGDGFGSYVDTHVHINGITPGPGAPVYDFEAAAANLLSMMEDKGVSKALIIDIFFGNSDEAATAQFVAALGAHPGKLYLMAGSPLRTTFENTGPDEVTEPIRAQFKAEAEKLLQDGAIGFGEILLLHLSMNANHIYRRTEPNHPLMKDLADIAAEHNVPIGIHMEAVAQVQSSPPGLLEVSPHNPAILEPTLDALEELLEHNRSAKIVWQHIGWDNVGDMTVENLRTLLLGNSNLYLSMRVSERTERVGGDGPMPNRIVDEEGVIKEEWLELFEEFPDRFMIGSDEFIPVPEITAPTPKSLEGTWDILAQMPSALARKIGQENAVRVYNLQNQ